jgi:phosphate transport system protein
MAASKCVAELERIGDEAVLIARMASHSDTEPGSERHRKLTADVRQMGEMAGESLQQAVELFDVWAEAKAEAVRARQRDIAQAFEALLRRLITRPLSDAGAVSWAMGLVLVMKALERIGHSSRNLTNCVMEQVHGYVGRDGGN